MMKNLNSRQDYNSNQSMGADKSSSSSSYVRTKIFVGNIHESVQASELRKIFDQYGNVVECEKIAGKDYAFVHYESADQAERAVKSLKDYELKGKKLIVQLSTNTRPPRGNDSNTNTGSSKQLKSKIFSVKSSVNVPSRGGAQDNRMRPYPSPYERRGAHGHKPLQQPDLAYELAQYSPPPPLGPLVSRSYNMPPGAIAHGARYPYDDRRSNLTNPRQLRGEYMAPLYDSNDLAYELVAERPRTPSPPPPSNDRYFQRDYYGRNSGGGAPGGSSMPPYYQEPYAQNEPQYRRKDNNYERGRPQYSGSAPYPKGGREYGSRQKHDSRAPWPLSPNDLAATLMRGASPPPPYTGGYGGGREVDMMPYQSYGGRGGANQRSGKNEDYYSRGAPGSGSYPPVRDSYSSRQNDNFVPHQSRGNNQEGRGFQSAKPERHHHNSQQRNQYPSHSSSGKAPRNR